MFEGFTLERIDVGDAELRVRHGGSGPAVLLLGFAAGILNVMRAGGAVPPKG